MTGKTHLLFGLTTGAATALVFYNPESAYFAHPFLFTSLAVVGSLAPDLDTPESLLSKQLSLFSKILCSFCKHRTYTHDVVLWTVVGIVLSHFYPLLFGFFLGYWGHLLLDSMTINGIPWLYFLHRNEYYRTLKHGTIHFFPVFMRFHSSSIWAIVTAVITLAIYITAIGRVSNFTIESLLMRFILS